jgi:hypothetical protein
MPTSLSRRCTLLDVMALIAATAIGLCLVRTYSLEAINDNLTQYPFIPRILLTIWAAILAVLPVPAVWSIALFGLRLRRPRPALRRLVRQPGFVAAGAVTLVAAVRMAGFLVLIARTFGRTTLGALYDVWAMSFFRGPIDVATLYNSVYFASSAIGTSMAVAAAWLLLAVSGRWRSEPGWLDGLGRILGTFWIAIIPFSCWWDYHVLY